MVRRACFCAIMLPLPRASGRPLQWSPSPGSSSVQAAGSPNRVPKLQQSRGPPKAHPRPTRGPPEAHPARGPRIRLGQGIRWSRLLIYIYIYIIYMYCIYVCTQSSGFLGRNAMGAIWEEAVLSFASVVFVVGLYRYIYMFICIYKHIYICGLRPISDPVPSKHWYTLYS